MLVSIVGFISYPDHHITPVCRRVNAPTNEELNKLVHTISQRIARFLTRKGLLVEDTENSYLALEGLEEGSMQQILPCFKVA